MRKLFVPLAIGAALLAASFSTESAHAQEAKLVAATPSEAEIHFNSAQLAHEAGNDAAALTELEDAYRLSGRSDVLQQLRDAHQAEGDAALVTLALRCYPADLDPPAECGQPMLQPNTQPDVEPVAAEPAPMMQPAMLPPPRDETGRIVSYVLTGAGIGLVLAATFVGFSSVGTQSTLDDRCGTLRNMCPAGFEADRDRGITLGIVADVLGIGGAAVLGTGIAMLFLSQDDDAPPVQAACGPTGCMLSATGSF